MAALSCLPAYGWNSAWDDAVAKAARISGLWVATPNWEQLSVFSPDPFLSPDGRVFLGIHSMIRQQGEAVEITIEDAALELEEKFGLPSIPYFYEQVPLGNAIPGKSVTMQGVEAQLTGFGSNCCEASEAITVRVLPGNDANHLTVVISSASKSAFIEFARPAGNPNAQMQGDWIAPGAALHIYVDLYHTVATFDKISENQMDLGYPFKDSGSDLKLGVLRMRLDTPHGGFHQFDATSDGPNRLKVNARGMDLLGESDFHRQVSGNAAPPTAPKP